MTLSNNVMLCLVFRKQNFALCDKSNKKTAFDAVFLLTFTLNTRYYLLNAYKWGLTGIFNGK